MEETIMKKIIILFFILTLLGSQVISYAQNEVQYTDFEAKVIEIKKDVKYRKARDWWKFWKWEDLSSEVKLKAGALLKVGKDSQLELEFINGTRVLVKANSNLEIANGKAGKNKSSYFRKQSLKLTLGEVWVKTIESLSGITRFEVRTPNAVAGVKGTLFNVKVDSKQETEVRVDEGRVLVANNNDDERTVGKLQRLRVNREGEFEEIKKDQEASNDWKSVKPWMEELEDWVKKKKHEIEEKKEGWKEEEQEREEESEEERYKDNEERDEDDRNHDKNDDESNNDHRRDDNISDDGRDKDDSASSDNNDRDDSNRDKDDSDNNDRDGHDRDKHDHDRDNNHDRDDD